MPHVNCPGEPEPPGQWPEPGGSSGPVLPGIICAAQHKCPQDMGAQRGGVTGPRPHSHNGDPAPVCLGRRVPASLINLTLSQGRRTSARGTGPRSRTALVPARGGAAALPLSPPSRLLQERDPGARGLGPSLGAGWLPGAQQGSVPGRVCASLGWDICSRVAQAGLGWGEATSWVKSEAGSKRSPELVSGFCRTAYTCVSTSPRV